MDRPLEPEVLWAQRTNQLFVTINVPDVQDPKIEIDSDRIYFRGTQGHRVYEVELSLFKSVESDTAKLANPGRCIFLCLDKTEKDVEYWPSLTKGKGKSPNVKIDFSRWIEEDENEENEQVPGMGDFDFSSLAGMGGGTGGFPDMKMPEGDFGASSDEEEDAMEEEMEK